MYSSSLWEKIFMYADDTLLIPKADNINEVTRKAQKALQSIANFAFETEQNPEKNVGHIVSKDY